MTAPEPILQQPVAQLHHDQFRVTSIPHQSSKHAIFCGVPIKKNAWQINSGKYTVTIKVDTQTLPVMPSPGQLWEVEGYRKVSDREVGDFLMQEHIYESPKSLVCNLPEDGEQLIQFIAKEKDFAGIGEVKARKLWQQLGNDFHEVVCAANDKARHRIGSILTDDAKTKLFEGYHKYKNLQYCNWMSTVGIPNPVQQRLLKYHDEKSVEAIQGNPYRLMGFGMSFTDVDNLIMANSPQLKLEITNCDPLRLSAALEAAIQHQVSKGHTYTTQALIRPRLKQLLGDDELVTSAFKVGHSKAQFILNKDSGTYHPTGQLVMEMVVAKRFKSLLSQPNSDELEAENAYESAVWDLPYELTDKQHQAVMMTLRQNISAITGGAGTGKTTVLRTALKAYHNLNYTIHAVALSGRAAMRLHESIGFDTMTIAALLRERPIEPSADTSANHVLVIDEASMIDLPTMYRIVTHLHPTVRIIFTGDPDQLPPIGAGKVLSDIVESDAIPNTKLDIVKRQEGSTGIPEYSRLINQGIVPESLTTGNIVFHQTDKEDIASTCANLYQDAPEESRVVAPTRAMVASINELVQSKLNPDGQRMEFTLHGDKFFRNLRLNDAILFTKNNYAKDIQNGSLGTLTSVECRKEVHDEATLDIYGEVTLDTGDTITITDDVLDCMELGYAITLHKAQGSQFPRIIIGLQKGTIVDRAWLYTAITRAETEIHIVGSQTDFMSITRNISNANKRMSYLPMLLAH